MPTLVLMNETELDNPAVVSDALSLSLIKSRSIFLFPNLNEPNQPPLLPKPP